MALVAIGVDQKIFAKPPLWHLLQEQQYSFVS